MVHDTLGGEDAAWLHMESARSPMVVSGVLDFVERLPIERVRPIVERLAKIPRLRATVAEPPHGVGLPRWVPVEDVDLSYHLRHVDLDDGGEHALRTFLGAEVSATLDPSRPLWRITLVDRPGAGTALVFRIHHAVADGFALLGLMLSVCDPDPALEAQLGRVRPAVALPTIRGAAAAVSRLVLVPPDDPTHLKNPLSGDKGVAWTRPFRLDEIRRVAAATKASVNDVVVAVVAGALRRQLRRRGDHGPGVRVHAMLPVNLRRDTKTVAPGNHVGLVVLDLPVSIEDPIARVGAAEQRMRMLKSTPEAVVAHELLRALGGAPKKVEEVVVSFFAQKTSLVLTNVPGPRVRLKLAGVPISRVFFWVPQAGRLGLGLSVLSYAGDVTIGVIADHAVLERPESLVTDLEAELQTLVDEVSSTEGRGPSLSPSDARAAWRATLEQV
ncbi:MAG: wax ester/triacylglycerol synthase family O-acyltransferase [Deltaproteobacteria bacterium]|nr:wax ester/triacylglycerol synthase family O-acyltransferase [Deltaproteobacteria bacterium]